MVPTTTAESTWVVVPVPVVAISTYLPVVSVLRSLVKLPVPPVLSITREIGWQWPGPSDFFIPAMGCAVGVGACLAWRDGRILWRSKLITLVVALLTAPVVAGIALLAVSQREPLVREIPAVTSAL